jgi:hypothetical protein
VTDERARGVVLYALAGVMLLGGGVWFVRADPKIEPSEDVAGWRATAERVLPDTSLQSMAETVVLTSGGRTERTSPVASGAFILSMLCTAPTGQVRVRLSPAGADTGRAVPCDAEKPEVARVQVALVEQLYLRLSAENADQGAVFRWRLDRNRGF